MGLLRAEGCVGRWGCWALGLKCVGQLGGGGGGVEPQQSIAACMFVRVWHGGQGPRARLRVMNGWVALELKPVC